MTKITVYSTRTCPYCIKLKKWLDERSVKYTSYDIDQNPIAAANMARIADEMIVPFSVVELDDGTEQKIIGFDVEKFEKVLKK